MQDTWKQRVRGASPGGCNQLCAEYEKGYWTNDPVSPTQKLKRKKQKRKRKKRDLGDILTNCKM